MTSIEFGNKLIEEFGDRIRAAAGNSKNLTVYVEINDKVEEFNIDDFSEENLEKVITEIDNLKF